MACCGVSTVTVVAPAIRPPSSSLTWTLTVKLPAPLQESPVPLKGQEALLLAWGPSRITVEGHRCAEEVTGRAIAGR
jgi:hypothetical protein